MARLHLPRPLRSPLPLLLVLTLGSACPDEVPPTEDGSTSVGTSSSSSTGSSGNGPGTTTTEDTTGVGSASGEGSSSSGSMADSTDTGSTTASVEESSGSSSTGPLPDVGCADGEREALVDDVMYPDIAACAGGWSVPGVLNGTPFCDNEGGDDGINPNGRGCTIDDLCAENWHLCESSTDVSDSGMANCGAPELEWNGSFFATRQSGLGANTCNVNGTNDVFGCGSIGHPMINGCAPLNRSTGDLCGGAGLMPEWECNVSNDSEAEFLVKEVPELGGALCCRD